MTANRSEVTVRFRERRMRCSALSPGLRPSMSSGRGARVRLREVAYRLGGDQPLVEDFWRINGGRLAEHWDIGQQVTEDADSPTG